MLKSEIFCVCCQEKQVNFFDCEIDHKIWEKCVSSCIPTIEWLPHY